MPGTRFLFVNGVISSHTNIPPVATVLETHPGVYTTTRTHNCGSILLFWERHLQRLANSARILSNSNSQLLFKYDNTMDLFSFRLRLSDRWDSKVRDLVNDSMKKVLPIALKEKSSDEELVILTLLSGNTEKLSEVESLSEENFHTVFDAYVHVGMYTPSLFGFGESVARLAMVGHGRDVANAKYSDWVRLRKSLEKLRPPLVTELLLSNDGDQILEGCLTNFFVVCRENGVSNSTKIEDKNPSGGRQKYSIEIQTASLGDGVLPGVIRQVISVICAKNGIPLREVAPQWSMREMWEEAFITNSLRILQHVESIQVPTSWELLEAKTWKEVVWEEKRFQDGPGRITSLIQKEIMERACLESCPVTKLTG